MAILLPLMLLQLLLPPLAPLDRRVDTITMDHTLAAFLSASTGKEYFAPSKQRQLANLSTQTS